MFYILMNKDMVINIIEWTLGLSWFSITCLLVSSDGKLKLLIYNLCNSAVVYNLFTLMPWYLQQSCVSLYLFRFFFIFQFCWLIFFFIFLFYALPFICVLLNMLQLGDLKLGELLDTPPPGLDEAIAISKACIISYYMFN